MKTGQLDPPSHLRGRPRVLNVAAMEDIRELIHEAPSLLLDEVAEWLAIYHEQPISTTTFHDNLHRLGLTCKKLQKVAAECNDAYRVVWMYAISTNCTAASGKFQVLSRTLMTLKSEKSLKS